MSLGVVFVGGAPTIFVALGDIFVGGAHNRLFDSSTSLALPLLLGPALGVHFVDEAPAIFVALVVVFVSGAGLGLWSVLITQPITQLVYLVLSGTLFGHEL